MTGRFKRCLLASVAFACVWPIAPLALAQEATDPIADEGEVVVTAQRREERLQDVGIAVSAYSGDTLVEQGLTSTTEIARFTPGVTVSGTLGGQGLQFSVRGVTQSDYNDAIEAPVAVYIDDVYIASQQGQGAALFDVSRVEALKGPQGTLFGRNATGGLVHFVVNTPELNENSGYARATYGEFNQTVLEGAANVALGRNVAVRGSGIWTRRDSIWENRFAEGMAPGAPLNFGPAGVSPAGEDLGDEDTLAGRLQVLWEPSADLSLRLSTSVLQQDLSESPWTSSAQVPVVDGANRVVNSIYASPTETRAAIGPGGTNFYNPAVLPFQGFLFQPGAPGERAPGANWFGYTPLDADELQLSKDFALSDLNRFRAYNTALHADWHVGEIDIASVTAFSRYDKHFLLDADGSPVNGFAFGTLSDMDTFSQEVRFSGGGENVNWVAGLYYLDIDSNVAQGLLAPQGSALAAVYGMAATGVDPLSVFRLQTQSTSVFAQADWEFAPRWTVVAGARVINEEQQYEYSAYATANLNNYSVDLGPALFPLYPAFTDEREDLLWAAKLQLEYRPIDELLIYFGINRGVKGGSYNGKLVDGTPPLPDSQIPYLPEELLSFETGFKFETDDRRFRLNVTAFHYDYTNYQSFVFADISGFVSNEEMSTTGVEVEASVRLTEDLRLTGTAAWTDATVEGFEIAPGVTRDTRPTYTPEYSASARLEYSTELGGGFLDLGALVSYQSDFYHNARNFDGDLYDGRTLLDLNANWELPSGLSIGAYINNVTDERYKTVGLNLATACGCNLEAYGAPRTWGVRVGYEF